MDSRRIYYVYKYYIVDTNEIFYIGKGSGNRCKKLSGGDRSRWFTEVYKSNNCDYDIIANNLTEEEAFELEKKLISYYKNKPMSILTNRIVGGGGTSGHKRTEEMKRQISLRTMGENNPNYGHKWTDEMKAAASKRIKENRRTYAGDKNPKARKVRCIENGKVFTTMQAAAEWLGLRSGSSINVAMSDPARTARGTHWEYVRD